MKATQLLIVALTIALLCADSQAQVRVTKTMSGASLLDISGLQHSGTGAVDLFYKTLTADLERSGWFTIITVGRAEFTVTGTIAEKVGTLEVRCEAYNVMSRERYLGKSYRMPATDVRIMAHRVADDIIAALTGHPGMASTKILMVGARAGNKELYICDADGHNLRQLTHDNSISLSPKWSPDATQFVYTSFLARFPDVYLVTLSSGKRQKIAGYPGLNACASISPDGRELALTLSKDGNPDLFVKNLQTGKLTQLTRTKRAAEASPAWAPDGRSIVFVSDSSGSPQLYIIDRAGGAARRITSSGSENVDPDWGKNGFIVYSSQMGRQYHVCVLNPQTLAFRQISNGPGDFEDPAWAPDGRHIVCSRTQNYNSRLFVLDSMSSSCVSLLPDSEKGDWLFPAWSPK